MSGPLAEDFDPTSLDVRGRAPADTRPEPGFLDQVAASFRVGLDEEEIVQADRLASEYLAIADALVERGVPREKLYRTKAMPAQVAAFSMGAAPATGRFLDRDTMWRYIAAERAKDPKAFSELQSDRASHDRFVLNRRGAGQRDEATLARGSGVSSVLANVVGAGGASFADPVNVLTLPLGGGGKTLATRILTEGLVQAGIEAVQTPGMVEARRALGKETTAGDIALNIGGAFVAGAGFRGVAEAAPTVGRVAGDALGRIDDAAYRAARPVREAVEGTLRERELARALAKAVPDPLRTPEQQAALQVLTRELDIEDLNPFARTHEAVDLHVSRMAEAMEAIEAGRLAAPDTVKPVDLGVRVTEGADFAAPPVGGRADFAEVKAAIRGPESGGNDAARNALGSSASGRYQFIEGTFRRLYRQEFGGTAREAQVAWNTRRFDVAVQERLMDRLLAENAAALERAGLQADTGNLYVAHFAGSGKAVELLRADPNAPVARFFSPQAVAQNPGYLGGGKTVGQALAIIRGKVGDGPAPRAGGLAGIDIDPETPLVRPDALDAERPLVATSAGREVPIAQFRAADIGVDAELMQFKSGGDQFGVTERLQGVAEWDPIAAGTVTVWEGADGRRLIADGHQRLGLARRVQEASGNEVRLNAFVLRESEGFSARDARIITALKNIGEGTGSAADAAKVVRDAGPEFADAIARRLPPKSALVRDGKALARLDDEAFGAVINEVIPEQYGAAIGDLVPDRAQHMAMVRVLAETDPPNRRQAEAIIRQARDAGFTTEVQDSLFGSAELTTSLFAQRAKALDKALAELRKMKGAFGVAARNAETLDSAGNRIDVAASEAAALDNARALALVERLALRKGNAVNEIINDAAARLGNGEKLASVVRDTVRDIRKLDLNELERGAGDSFADGGAGRAGDDAGGAGRAGEPAREDGYRAADDDSELSPADIDAAEEAGLFGPPDPDAPLLRAFDDDAGEGVQATAESLWHDLRAEADPNLAARTRQELDLQAQQPLRGARKTGQAQADTMPEGLFGGPDEPTFDLDDGLGPRTAAEIDAEIAAERAAIEAMRKCLI